MIRRRRRVREIPFSFDSFLDIVANVVGIIIRLILVVWVGARSYSSLQTMAKPPSPVAQRSSPVSEPSDPLQDDLTRHARELAQARERLLAELRRLQQTQEDETQVRSQLVAVGTRQQRLQEDRTALAQTAQAHAAAARSVALSSAELRRAPKNWSRKFEHSNNCHP